MEAYKKLFINAFGFESDSYLTELSKKMKTGLVGKRIMDFRGRQSPHNKLPPEVVENVKNHIISFGPSTPHYSHKNAPNIRYLPSSLTVDLMHQDFVTKNPVPVVSHETYRRELKEMNISLKMPACDVFPECVQSHGER